MIHKSNSQPRRGKPFLVFLACLSLIGSVSCSAVGDKTINASDAINTINANNQRHLQDALIITDILSISEAYQCIPASEVQQIHETNDPRLPWGNGNSGAIQRNCYLQENSCGSATAPSACCRVSFEAGWLVCDAYNAFDFMPCICNDNTFGTIPTAEPTTIAPTEPIVPTVSPTKAPTGSPTVSPTALPTGSPTKSPTNPPTVSPTHEPTAEVIPTLDPTANPTASPTSAPTIAPVAKPTESPTAFPTPRPTPDPTPKPSPRPTPDPTPIPTALPTAPPPTAMPTNPPTAMPTQFPTSSPAYTTENKFDADINDMIRQSQCKTDPTGIPFVEASTFRYRYEVTLLEGSADGVLLNDLWKDGIHDELARELMICDGYDDDSVWILQSKSHFVDESTPCSGDDSNDSSCISMVAESRVIVYDSPIGERNVKTLWSDNSYQEGETADKFAEQALTFLEDRLNSGDAGLGFVPTFGVSFQGGEIVQADQSTEDNSEGDGETGGETGGVTGGETGSDSSSGGDSSGSAGEGTSDSGEPADDDADLVDSSVLWKDDPNDTATAIGIETGAAGSSNPGRLTPAMIATIAAVASCLLLIVVLGAISRNKRNKEFREDEEYLQDVATPKSDKYYSPRPVDHLDLSDSTDSSGPDIERNVTSVGPNSHRGPKFGSPRSPSHFHFSGFSGSPKSPTSRERNKMGPLGLTDEFREQSSGSERDSSATGTHRRGIVSNSSSMSSTNHRGIVSNSSSNSSTNHRGIVSNSSSMSSNNNGNIPPPHQNNSPRLYQLRDTVKL